MYEDTGSIEECYLDVLLRRLHSCGGTDRGWKADYWFILRTVYP